MKFLDTHIAGLLLIEPAVFSDERGYFFEAYNAAKFSDHGLEFNFIQDNEAKSARGVLRGLHFQRPPYTQTKLVRVISGEIFDVAVDLRAGSETYGRHYGVCLNDTNKLQLLVPKGFAHGYLVLSETAVVTYKVDEKYAPGSEDGIRWNDESLGINWTMRDDEVVLSQKDEHLQELKTFKTPFV